MSGDFSQRYGPWAVVAGASDGIGASVARLLGDRGVNVVLVARRRATLEEVAATIPSETRTLVLDLSEPQAATELAEATADLPVGLLRLQRRRRPECLSVPGEARGRLE